jgi:hypothetical protein
VLIRHRRELRRAGPNSGLDDTIWRLDDKKNSARCSTQGVRAETSHLLVRPRDPEGAIADGELHHDVIALSDPMKHVRPECPLVESYGVGSAFNPELRLKVCHPIIVCPRRGRLGAID